MSITKSVSMTPCAGNPMVRFIAGPLIWVPLDDDSSPVEVTTAEAIGLGKIDGDRLWWTQRVPGTDGYDIMMAPIPLPGR